MTAWIITKDNISQLFEEKHTHKGLGKCDKCARGTYGPSTASDADHARLMAGEGIPFRLRDDDGETHYYGRRLETSDADAGYPAENELAPLDNWGTPNSGAVIQEEKNSDGEWESIN